APRPLFKWPRHAHRRGVKKGIHCFSRGLGPVETVPHNLFESCEIKLQSFRKELLLRPESGVEAFDADSHSLSQIGYGCPFISIRPEQFHGLPKGSIAVEVPRAAACPVCQGVGFGFLHRSMHMSVDTAKQPT